MIQTRTLSTGQTEIFVENRGGVIDYLTESYPTYFHNRYTRKVLTSTESISDFKEVTAQEWAAIEAQDAKWERPPQAFIDLWNKMCCLSNGSRVGKYNETTGYFELNKLTLTYEEAITVFYETYLRPYPRAVFESSVSRTFLPLLMPFNQSAHSMFLDCTNLEILGMAAASTFLPTVVNNTFYGCKKLRRIEARTAFSENTGGVSSCFVGCESLEYINFEYVRCGLDLHWSPNLTLEMMDKLVIHNYGIPTKGITLTVHADVYAKLTGDLTNPAASALSAEELAQWTALPAQAAEKNIIFTTP